MIVDIRADQSRLKDAQPEPSLDAVDYHTAGLPEFDLVDDMAVDPPLRGVVGLFLAIVLAAAWIGAVVWLTALTRPELLSLAGLLPLIPALLIGPTLIGVIWMLSLRTSRAESRRFGHAAEAMRAEAARLERSVAAMTRLLDANRRELAQQVDQLAALGDAAAERLGGIGRGLAAEIAQADDHARSLTASAGAAQTNVGAILASLPQARVQTEELTRALDASAEVATRSVDDLAARMLALAEHGRVAEAGAGAAAASLAEQVARIDSISGRAAERLSVSTNATAGSLETLLGRTNETVEAAKAGIDQHGEAMVAMVSAHHARLDAAARDSADALAARLDGAETSVERLAERLEQQRVAGDALVAGIESGIVRVAGRIDVLHEQGIERSQQLAGSISGLGGSADAMTEALRAGEAMATRTIGTAESLLIALDAAAREIDETLPDALTRLDVRVAQSKSVVVKAKPELLALVTAAESTHDAIEAIAGVVHDQRRTLDQLSTGLNETLSGGRAKADALGQVVEEAIERAHRFAEEAAPRLIEALLRVRETAAAAADHARTALAEVIPEAAESMRSAAGEAFHAAAADTVSRQIDSLAEATEAAVAAATRATERLAAHVRDITEQTAIVETHLDTARGEREAADRDTLSQRVARLIETLNSASIDIAKSFAPEVADSAWAAYLKGDRGVFTRRAVRLLDSGDARNLARMYDERDDFRDQVNRYIHDFEGMLRGILAQRDGTSLGVTLLSSDMGKLYVALAQAIERLR